MRPIKQGLSYFPLDVDVDTDDKIVLIESRFGTEGFTVVIKLMMKIYKEGYFYRWTERELLLFAQRIKVEEPVVDAIVKDCIKWNLFNKKLFNKYQILTSTGIQERFFEATKRRLKINVCKEYTLIPVNDYINKDNVNIYSINDDISTQRKEKKKEIESNSNGIYTDIFNYWNTKKIIKHNKLTDAMSKKIQGKLNNDYKVEEIKRSILNYEAILSGEEYFFKYRWTLEEFLQRGFEKFKEWEICSENYLIEEDKWKKG